MKSIANGLTIMRMLLAFTLALIKPFSTAFLIIYLICGLSDVFDGYIARKTGTASKLGDNLDSVSDLIMYVVLIIVLYPVINPTIQIVVWIVVIILIRAVSVIVVFLKYKTFEILHTYGNKMSGFMLFIFPLLFAFVRSNVPIYIVCVTASISAIEELLIHLSSDKLQISKKTIFSK